MSKQEKEKKSKKVKAKVSNTKNTSQSQSKRNSNGTAKEKDVGKSASKVARNPNAKWYIVSVYSGKEEVAKKEIEKRVDASGFGDRIVDIVVPKRKRIVVKDGKQIEEEENVFPGYVIIQMEYDKDTWAVIQNTERVRGFVRTGDKPRPLSDAEVENILRVKDKEGAVYKVSLRSGDAIKVRDGPFKDFVGTVSEVDEDKGLVTVLLSFFGRETPKELSVSDIEQL